MIIKEIVKVMGKIINEMGKETGKFLTLESLAGWLLATAVGIFIVFSVEEPNPFLGSIIIIMAFVYGTAISRGLFKYFGWRKKKK